MNIDSREGNEKLSDSSSKGGLNLPTSYDVLGKSLLCEELEFRNINQTARKSNRDSLLLLDKGRGQSNKSRD